MGYWWFIDDGSIECTAVYSHTVPRHFALLPKTGCYNFHNITQLCQVILHYLIQWTCIFKKKKKRKERKEERKRLNNANNLFSSAANWAKLFWQENPCVTGQDAAFGSGGGRSRCWLRQVGSGGGMERPLPASSAPCACHHPNADAALGPPHLEGWKAGRQRGQDGWAKNAEFIQRRAVAPRNGLSFCCCPSLTIQLINLWKYLSKCRNPMIFETCLEIKHVFKCFPKLE